MAGEQVKKRKKNAPDRPQPAWLFPPQEENPVLNPKPVSEDQIRKAETERQNAVDFLKRRAYGVPDRPPPDPQLLSLIAVFLTEYGFSSTCRMFTTERNGRKTLNGWADEVGGKLKPGTPRLAKIHKDWLKEWEERRALDMTSDEEDDAATKREKMIERRANPKAKRSKVEDEQTSSSGSESSSDEASEADVEMKDAPPAQRAKHSKGAASGTSSSASSRSSSSESDADDEKETRAVKAPSPKPTVNNLVNKLKRKAASDSTDKAASEDKPSLAKKAKLDTTSDKTKSDKKAGVDKKVKADKGEKKVKPDKGEKKVKAEKSDKRAATEDPIDTAKPTKAEKKAKKGKKTDTSANMETSTNPAVTAPVAEPSPEKPALDSAHNPAQKPLPASSSSSSSSDSESSSASEPAPPKKTKSTKSTKKSTAQSTSASAVTGDSKRQISSDSSATLENNEPKKASASASSSSSTSSSSSPSSSSSDSDSDSASTPPPKKSKKKTKSKSKSSTKSNDAAPPPTTTATDAAPKEKPDNKTTKKQNTPFSRIAATTPIDPRVASNAYVPYDYAERAHRDLIVTKGKGFTKEKNKKKRGSYRGGMIDVEGRKGVKFEE